VNCWRVQNLIAPFLDDELPGAESEALAEHLEECPPCRDIVEGVAALPDFPRVEVDAEVESTLWSEFDRCLAARIADSLVEPAAAAEATPAGVLQGDLRVPRTLAVAAAAVVVMLVGWNWTTYERLDRLEASLQERDAIIVALQERVADRGSDHAFAFTDPATDLPVLLPANAPGATALGSTRLPNPYRPVGYQVAANPSPTLIR